MLKKNIKLNNFGTRNINSPTQVYDIHDKHIDTYIHIIPDHGMKFLLKCH